MLAQSTDVPYWDPSLFGQEFALPPGYGTSFTVRAVEAGGMRRAASRGPIPSPYPHQIRDNGVQSPNWGRMADIYRGKGGYSYQYLNDGSIKIVAGPNSVGSIVKPGTSAHSAIYAEMQAAGAIPGAAGTQKPNLTDAIISGLTQVGVAAVSQPGGARQPQRRAFAPSGAAAPAAPPMTGTEGAGTEGGGGFPWGIVVGGSVLVVGGLVAALVLPGLLSGKAKKGA
jgi:hypothetical protein